MASHDRRRCVGSYSVLPWHNTVKGCIIGKLPLCQNEEETGKWRIFCAESFRRIFFFFISTFGKKTKKQQQQSWSAFGRGCDRAPKDFMGRCHMIHWVIGFRPVLIAGRPRPKKSRRIPTSSPPFSRMEFGLQVPHVIQGVLHSFRGPNSNHMEASVRLRTFHQQKKKKRDTRSHWLLRDGKWGVLKEKDNKQI